MQPEDAVDDENIRILHRNMLFPIQTVINQDLITTATENENRRHLALMKANALMNIHFDNKKNDEKIGL